jgi:hypothetical protein
LRNEPGQNFFSNLALFSHTRPIGMIHKGVASCALVRLDSTVTQNSPCGLSHAVRATPSNMARLSHPSPFSMTGPLGGPRPSFFLLSLSFFLLVFHLPLAPLVILDFSSLIRARGATNQLHELVFQSCWVHTSSLPSHFLVF